MPTPKLSRQGRKRPVIALWHSRCRLLLRERAFFRGAKDDNPAVICLIRCRLCCWTLCETIQVASHLHEIERVVLWVVVQPTEATNSLQTFGRSQRRQPRGTTIGAFDRPGLRQDKQVLCVATKDRAVLFATTTVSMT